MNKEEAIHHHHHHHHLRAVAPTIVVVITPLSIRASPTVEVLEERRASKKKGATSHFRRFHDACFGQRVHSQAGTVAGWLVIHPVFYVVYVQQARPT